MTETETLAFRDRDEAETLTVFAETRPRQDVDTSRDRLETETSRPIEIVFETTTLPRRVKIVTTPCRLLCHYLPATQNFLATIWPLIEILRSLMNMAEKLSLTATVPVADGFGWTTFGAVEWKPAF